MVDAEVCQHLFEELLQSEHKTITRQGTSKLRGSNKGTVLDRHVRMYACLPSQGNSPMSTQRTGGNEETVCRKWALGNGMHVTAAWHPQLSGNLVSLQGSQPSAQNSECGE